MAATELRPDEFYDFQHLVALRCKDCGGLCTATVGCESCFLGYDYVLIPVSCQKCGSGFSLHLSLVG